MLLVRVELLLLLLLLLLAAEEEEEGGTAVIVTLLHSSITVPIGSKYRPGQSGWMTTIGGTTHRIQTSELGSTAGAGTLRCHGSWRSRHPHQYYPEDTVYHSADHSPAGGYRIYIPGIVYLGTDDWRDCDDNRYRGGIFLWGYISRVRNSVCRGDTPPRIDMVLVLVVLLFTTSTAAARPPPENTTNTVAATNTTTIRCRLR